MNTIKLLAMDVDGTMTDGCINYSEHGELFKQFDVRDGMGIKILQNVGIKTAIITGRLSNIVKKRAEELSIDEVIQGTNDKLSSLKELAKKYGLAADMIAYIGDDVNDIAALNYVGLAFAPADAFDDVLNCDVIVLKHNGGRGAIRECCEYIIKFNKELQQ